VFHPQQDDDEAGRLGLLNEHDALGQELVYRLAQQSLVSNLGLAALRERDLTCLYAEACRLSAEGLRARYAELLLPVDASDGLLIAAGWGLSPTIIGTTTIPGDVGSPAGFALKQSIPIVTDHIDRESRFAFPEMLRELGVVRAINVPIIQDGQAIGVLEVDSLEDRRFTSHDVAFLQAIANVLAAAMDRQTTESRLRESNERLGLALETGRLGAWEFNLATQSLYGTGGAKAALGLASDKPLDWKYVLAAILPEDRAAVLAAGRSAVVERTDFMVNHRVLWPEGSVHYLHSRARPLVDSEGNVQRLVGVTLDLTEREATKAELNRQLELTKAIADNAAEAMFLLDGEGCVVFANPAAETMFGWPERELVGCVLPEIMPLHRADDRILADNECSLRHAILTGRPLRDHEDLFRRRDGSTVEVACSNAPVLDGGKVTGAVLVVHDITERRRVEDELARHRGHLEELVRERTRELKQSETDRRQTQEALHQAQKMEVLGQMTGGVAHDFNNLLTVIVGNLDLIAELGETTPRIKRVIETAQRAAARGEQLTSQLLAFSRRQALQPETLDVNAPGRRRDRLDRSHPRGRAVACRHRPWAIRGNPLEPHRQCP
jgi:PAS domain S-box-containing protein